ncbi:MAG: translation initiation factor IF-3 [Bacilli bacterium]
MYPHPPDCVLAVGKEPIVISINRGTLCVDTSVSTFFDLMEVFYIANAKNNLLINEQIKASQVLVIGPNGEQVGLKAINDALTLATYAGLDLVLINQTSNPPVCKVMDYNKYRYEKQKKEKEAAKKQKISNLEVKEFRLSSVIDVGDFETKIVQVTKYIEKGNKVKMTVRFKGRQLAHTELGREVLVKFAKRLEEIVDVEQTPKLDGKSMTMLLSPKKEK